jgi:spermidine/putrescine transport system substrate-binding protein
MLTEHERSAGDGAMNEIVKGTTEGRPWETLGNLRLSRRRLLRGFGAGLGASWLLAACGDGGDGVDSGGNPSDVFAGEPEGIVDVANWPIYIDKAKTPSGEQYIPSLREFQRRTGIEANYREVIEDYPSFLTSIVPQFQAERPIGWDVIVIGGRELTVLLANDWLTPLDPNLRPNFDAHATSWARDPAFDPGNRHTMAWQGGFTALGVNRNLTNGPITTLDDLANPDKVGRSAVGMISSEMPDFVMQNLGIDPQTSTPDDWREAATWLTMQRESGTVRGYFGQNYIQDMTAGNTSVSMAWSGDIFYYSVWAGQTELEFVLPEGGGLRWIDSMAIPVNAEHPVDAMTFMDFYYDPNIALMVTSWVLTMSPVEGVSELILSEADAARDDGFKGYANKLAATADNRFTFPDEEVLASTSFARDLRTEEEREEWDAIFSPISQT